MTTKQRCLLLLTCSCLLVLFFSVSALGDQDFTISSHSAGVLLEATVNLSEDLETASWSLSISQNRTKPTPLSTISVYFDTDKGGEELIYVGPWSEAVEPRYSYCESGNTSLPSNFSQITLVASISFQGENDRVTFSTEFNITSFFRTESFAGEMRENLPSTFPVVTVLCGFLLLGLLFVFLRRR